MTALVQRSIWGCSVSHRQRKHLAIASSITVPLRHITPFANDADWALVLVNLTDRLAEHHPHVRQHIKLGIRTLDNEIKAQLGRLRICETVLDPGATLKPLVRFTIDARVHELSTRVQTLHSLLYGAGPRVRAHLEVRKSAPANPDLETQENFIRAKLRTAVWVIRFVPFPRNGAPAGYRSCMPDPIVSYWDAFGREKAEATKPRPTAAQLTEADEVLHWLFWIEDTEARSVVFLRNIPLSWRKVGHILDMSATNAMHLERDAIGQISRKITTIAA